METAARKPSAERRREIVEAVLHIIAERGLTSLTTATIAAEVGVTSGALFRHFSSVGDILEETVRQAVARIEETFPDPDLPPLERLLTLARRRVRLLRDEPGLAWLLRSEQVYLMLPAEALAPLSALVVRSRRFLLAALREGASRGHVRDDLDPELLLIPVMGTIHVLTGLQGIHRTGAPSDARVERVFETLVQMLAPPLPHNPDPRRTT